MLKEPVFDENTVFQTMPHDTHKVFEASWIFNNVKDTKVGIVSVGHDGLVFANIYPDAHIFYPRGTPQPLIKKTMDLTSNVHFFGNNYPQCYETAADYMFQHEITNVSAGVTDKHLGNKKVVDRLLLRRIPRYVFVPGSNLDLAVGMLEGLSSRNMRSITLVICVLPDHFNVSPRFFTEYNHDPYFSALTFRGHKAPALNRGFKYFDNFIVKTVNNPDHCYYKYKDKYPKLDAMNYITMDISTKFKVDNDERKTVILTGQNLIEDLNESE